MADFEERRLQVGNFIAKMLMFCIGISFAMSVNAQESIGGRVLDEQKQGLDAAVVMLVSLPENVLIETTVTDSTGCFHCLFIKVSFFYA